MFAPSKIDDRIDDHRHAGGGGYGLTFCVSVKEIFVVVTHRLRPLR